MSLFFSLRPSFYFTTLSDIQIHWLEKQGIRGIILDLDNTIVSEDDRYLSPNVEAWLNQVTRNGIKIFLVSNGKRKTRFLYWTERFNLSGIQKARKPFRSGFQQAMRSMRLNLNQVAVIGDSLHTDILGAKFSNLMSIQVASLPHPKRWWENLIGAYIQIPYPKSYRLDFNRKGSHITHG